MAGYLTGPHHGLMAQTMTDAQWRGFVTAGTRTGKLSTVRSDGSPHVAPVWFLLDGDDVVFNTGRRSVKGHNLARTGQGALCVDDERPPFSFALLSGRAELTEDPPQVLRWAVRIAERYVGAEHAQEVGEHNAPGGLLVRMRIEHVVAVADLAA